MSFFLNHPFSLGALSKHPLSRGCVVCCAGLLLEDDHELVHCSTSIVHVGVGISPIMASVRESAAQMSVSAGVMVGIVKYLCLKKMVRHVCICLVSLMSIS